VVRAAREGAEGSGLWILAVTILTSLDRADLDASLIRDGAVSDLVVERAARAFEAGAHGVIASPQEAAQIRALPEAAGRLIVTPGRPAHGRRRRRPEADRHSGRGGEGGADHVVIGRPIHRAPDPRAAAQAVVADGSDAIRSH
jgi:orotidine-5'-phosphate decarboxylase